ncbi:hypothetical protein [Polyangium mundeleinium]|uniref:Uncharacterized protein n=1 Tax=Polyangium mundeleinium TaxID=2995306 RepID=A0ABT5EGR5_9BACT|nr:hypothetical protein [Polyangium mundeleinium]MDC0741019.1 hypothetical protein [Polyangium mundeleinium]
MKHSIHVDVEGALPPGKVLLMTGTFKGAAVIDTGTLVPFIIGRYESVRLYLIDSGDLPKVEAIRENWVPGTSAYEARDAITDRGMPCSDFLEIQRRDTPTSPVKEVRLFYTIKADGKSCASKHVRTDRLSELGAVIDSEPGSRQWPAVDAQPSAPSADSSAPPPSSSPPVASAVAPNPGSLPEGTSACGTCAVGAHADGRYAALLVLLGALVWTGRRALARGDRT